MSFELFDLINPEVKDFHDEMDVSYLQMSNRLRHVLEDNNIHTLKQLFLLTDHDIKSFKAAGSTCVKEVNTLKRKFYLLKDDGRWDYQLSDTESNKLDKLKMFLSIDDKHFQRLKDVVALKIMSNKSFTTALFESELFIYLLLLKLKTLLAQYVSNAVIKLENKIAKILGINAPEVVEVFLKVKALDETLFIETSPHNNSIDLLNFAQRKSLNDFAESTQDKNTLKQHNILSLFDDNAEGNLGKVKNKELPSLSEIEILKSIFGKNTKFCPIADLPDDLSDDDIKSLLNTLNVTTQDSYNLRYYIHELQKDHSFKKLAIIASTTIFKYYLLEFFKDNVFASGNVTVSISSIQERLKFVSAASLKTILNEEYFRAYFKVQDENIALLKANELLPLLSDGKELSILQKRMCGRTLEEVGNDFGITPERVRQIVTKFSKKHKQKLLFTYEGQFLKFYTQYDWTDYKAQFSTIFNLEDYATSFFENLLFEKCGVTSLLDFYYSTDISDNIKQALIIALKDASLNLNGVFIKNDRNSVLRYFYNHIVGNKRLASNQETIAAYHDFLKTLQLENTKHLEIDELYLINRSNAMEDFISNRQGTRRYYEFCNHNYEKLFEILSGYTNEKMSTIKLLKDFPELKDILGIDDHYELHAIIRMLSRRYKNKIPNISVSRSPMLTFGNNDF